MHRSSIFLLTAFICLTSFAPMECLSKSSGKPTPDFQDGKRKKHKDKDRERHKGEERIYPFSELGIPKGHLPPPGECRIWIPGVPPGQQGPPESCSSALRNVPLGAWVITHTGDQYKVDVYSRERPMVVIDVRIFALL